MSIIFDRALVLAKIESTFRTDAVPDKDNDALLVGNPEVNLDINQLTRDNVRSDLSPLATVSGRKVASMSFTHEVRNNGNTDGTTPPVIGVLLRGCGLAQTQITGASGTIGNAAAGAGNTGTISFAKTTAYTGYQKRTVTLTCTTGGASGIAEVTVSAPAIGETAAYSQTGVVVTDATAIDLPGSAQVTPTVGTSLDIGDEWTVVLTPAGYEYDPVSDNFESITLYGYLDGLLHKMTGCRGTFTVEGTGGEYANFNFTFTGDYVPVEDAAIPSNPAYETQKPTQVELANLTVGDYENFAASEFSLDMQNDVQIREDINALNAYAGALIVGRSPQLGVNPEAVLEATHPVWANLSAGTELAFSMKVGKVKGNTVAIEAPNTQYTNVQYSNRNNIRTYDISLNCARSSGNDEIKIAFR